LRKVKVVGGKYFYRNLRQLEAALCNGVCKKNESAVRLCVKMSYETVARKDLERAPAKNHPLEYELVGCPNDRLF
jgi:hypothetical protein